MGLDSYFMKFKRTSDYPLDTLTKALLVANGHMDSDIEDTVYFKNLVEKLQEEGAKIEEVGYFRKNFDLHKWMIKSCCGGIDDCLPHGEVTKENILSYMEILVSKLKSYNIEPINIVNSVRIKGEDLIVTKCDGIEYETSDNLLTRMLNGEEELYKINIADDFEYAETVGVLGILISILLTTDFETEAIVYLASW